jgi:hypothetical protein
MNPKYVLTIAALASLLNVSEGILIGAAAAAGAVTLTIGAGAIAPALVVGGLAIKAAALGLVAGGALGSRRGRFRGRGRREAIDGDESFDVIAEIEPEQCYQRLICDLATGQMPKSDNDIILELFKDGPVSSGPKVTFEKAARLGKVVKDIKMCEVQYSCPLTGEQINKLI